MRFEERVAGSFKGLATGDAIGKQTETLSRADVQKWYPEGIAGFHGQPGDIIPRYSGKRYEWRIGETTDDTEQTLAVARALVTTAEVSHVAVGRELLGCQKSAHPGVSLWDFLQARDPTRIAPGGNGCGAAMRAAPVGIVYPPGRLDELVHAAYECAIPTHGGQLAISAAAAVAGAVSAAVEGLPASEVIAVALRASQGAEGLRPSNEPFTMTQCIAQVYSDLKGRMHLTVDDVAQNYFPDRPQTIVPLAISLALITGSAEETALFAANLGGDSDSVASIGGAIAGALHPASVNDGWFDVVNRINGDHLLEAATLLAARRRGC